MYENQTETVILQRMLDRIKSNTSKMEGSFNHDATAPVSTELQQLYIELDYILKICFALTTDDIDFLKLRTAEFGIYQREGTKAVGTVTFTGADNTIIPAGTKVQTGGQLVYITKAQGTITGGKAVINVEAENIGNQYNVLPGMIAELPVQVVGVASVANEFAMAGGTDDEGIESLKERFLTSVQNPATSGNEQHYIYWAMSVPGVGGAKVFRNWDGGGTVKVVIIDTNKVPAVQNIVDATEAYIESQRPVGAEVTVLSAAGLELSVSCSITKASGYIDADIKANITNKITDYLKSIAFKMDYVSYAQVGNAILESEGVIDYSNLKINNGIANIPVNAEAVAILKEVTII